MADTLVKNPKLIVGTQSQVEAEMGANDIGFATDVEFYTKAEVEDRLLDTAEYIYEEDRKIKADISKIDTNTRTIADWINKKDEDGNRAVLETEAQDAYRAINELNAKIGAGGASLPILTMLMSDHVINDMSWLRADTFSWQSGDVYKAAYEHLVDDFNAATSDGEISFLVCNNYEYYRDVANDHVGQMYPYAWTTKDVSAIDTTLYSDTENPNTGDYVSTSFKQGGVETQIESVGRGVKTDTIGNITITYYKAQDGHKICLPDQESNLSALYAKTGAADYYMLDTTNKQFKLPRKQKRTLIQAVKNTDGTWYNLYSDGWVEQGGQIIRGVITFAIPMADLNYTVSGAQIRSGSTNGTYYNAYKFVNMRETGIDLDNAQSEDPLIAWSVSGYAAESAYASAGMRLEYYYVGNFEQSATEQAAGLNAELFNGKADRNLMNTTDNVDIVVESQLPTASNGYTWYRKYKSGWVEQGGRGKTNISVTLPVAMANSNYTVSTESLHRHNGGTGVSDITTTGFKPRWQEYNSGSWGSNNYDVSWQVSGIAQG